MSATFAAPRSPFDALDDDVIAHLRAALVADRAEQSTLVTENQELSRVLTGQRDVDSMLEREIADTSAARAREAIADIDEALARIAACAYGTCESCRTPIPVERLEAIPRARCCVACSEQH
jgi:RNA polymerase-binding transcription factor DksA